MNPALSRLYVASKDQQDVAVLHLNSMGQVGVGQLPKGPQAVRVDSVLGQAYAGYGDPLYVVSCSGLNVLGQMSKGSQ